MVINSFQVIFLASHLIPERGLQKDVKETGQEQRNCLRHYNEAAVPALDAVSDRRETLSMSGPVPLTLQNH